MSELFTELSDDQQELVAGGAVTILDIKATSFNSNTELLGSASAALSGPGGSKTVGNIAGANQEIDTKAFSLQFGVVK
ncbi:MAG: hypothetical protein HC851_14650 [Acaryochloris sp. RU_4_1]|jgi:hypothetical protein|nr:hypothetical protein [Acaryochloris sp. RU_4_1]NJR55583.1 hypothetical protein [Acaryochloris sp. CRU_2_0]